MITVRSLATGEETAWEAYVAEHPAATIYHRLAWRSIFRESFGYRAHYLAAWQEGAIVGVLPLFEVATPFSRRLVAVPFRDRGGPLWDQAEGFRALVAAAGELSRERRARFVELKSVESYPAALREEFSDDRSGRPNFSDDRSGRQLKERFYWVHSRLDLRGLTAEELFRRVGAKTRNMVRQAERSGLSFELCPAGQGLERWYAVYLHSQSHLGLPPLPRRFFARVLAREPVRVGLVLHQGQAVAATVIFLFRRMAMYAYSASLPGTRGLRPNDFMLHRLCLFLLEQGVEELDLGSDAPSQESLLFFKRKWLARQAPIPTYTLGQAETGAADSSHPRYRLAREVFRRLPLRVLEWTSVLARFFG